MAQSPSPDKETGVRKSAHILSVSSTLLGICFVVLTSLKLLGKSKGTIIDELAVAAIIFFMSSCCFSFLSFRRFGKRASAFENIADLVFMCGLFLLFITTLLFAFNVIS
ncbi:hypothetical protein [Flavitalea sp.]|nr:hypothetical protein [Flavitalea sp.]